MPAVMRYMPPLMKPPAGMPLLIRWVTACRRTTARASRSPGPTDAVGTFRKTTRWDGPFRSDSATAFDAHPCVIGRLRRRLRPALRCILAYVAYILCPSRVIAADGIERRAGRSNSETVTRIGHRGARYPGVR